MILPGAEVRLTGQQLPGSSFLPFLKMVQCFPFSGHQRFHLPTMTFQISQRVAQQHRPIPSGLWDASCHVP